MLFRRDGYLWLIAELGCCTTNILNEPRQWVKTFTPLLETLLVWLARVQASYVPQWWLTETHLEEQNKEHKNGSDWTITKSRVPYLIAGFQYFLCHEWAWSPSTYSCIPEQWVLPFNFSLLFTSHISFESEIGLSHLVNPNLEKNEKQWPFLSSSASLRDIPLQDLPHTEDSKTSYLFLQWK